VNYKNTVSLFVSMITKRNVVRIGVAGEWMICVFLSDGVDAQKLLLRHHASRKLRRPHGEQHVTILRALIENKKSRYTFTLDMRFVNIFALDHTMISPDDAGLCSVNTETKLEESHPTDAQPVSYIMIRKKNRSSQVNSLHTLRTFITPDSNTSLGSYERRIVK